jgi:hypothetical protein
MPYSHGFSHHLVRDFNRALMVETLRRTDVQLNSHAVLFLVTVCHPSPTLEQGDAGGPRGWFHSSCRAPEGFAGRGSRPPRPPFGSSRRCRTSSRPWPEAMLSEASAAPCDQTPALKRSIPEVGASLVPALALNAPHGESRPLHQATGPGETEALGLTQLSWDPSFSAYFGAERRCYPGNFRDCTDSFRSPYLCPAGIPIARP